MAEMSAVASIRTEWRAIVICLFITIAAFQFGFDSSYYSGKSQKGRLLVQFTD